MQSGYSAAMFSGARMKKYTATAIVVHWLMAVGLIGVFSFGLYMADLPVSPDKLKYYSWHKWAGVTLFAILVFRVVWRLTHRPPALPAHMGPGEQFVAHAGHGMLYLLMFAIPLSGWMMSSAKGIQTVLFGVLPIPDLLERNKELGALLQTAHWALSMLLAAVVIGHVAAALKHHLIDKDDVLSRMLPSKNP